MEADQFDWILRTLVTSPSRRKAVGGVAGILLAGMFGSVPRLVAAKRGKRKKRKGGKRKKKRNVTPPVCTPRCLGVCGDNGCGGSCGTCGVGEHCCNGVCVDLLTDAANCGACGRACPSGTCYHGACTCSGESSCPDGCTCDFTLSGTRACRALGVPPSGAIPCGFDDQCPIGSYCRTSGVGVCSRPCPG